MIEDWAHPDSVLHSICKSRRTYTRRECAV
jgi:hypothetical protein